LADGPGAEYVRILKSYLTPAQQNEMRFWINLRLRNGSFPKGIEFVHCLQAFLTPVQLAGVTEQLELAYAAHGWTASPPRARHSPRVKLRERRR
jgi:hypothetical protein